MTVNTGALALVSILGIGAGVYTQTGQQPPVDNGGRPVESEEVQPRATQPAQPLHHGQQLVDCAMLNTHHQQLATDVEAIDKELDQLVTNMRNAKTSNAKMDAMAAVVDVLATRDRQIRNRMVNLHHETMAYYMGHRDKDGIVEPCPITLEPESQLTPQATPDQTTPQQSPEMGPPAPPQ